MRIFEEMESENSFTDVKTEDWFAPYVENAYKKGLINGYENGSFKPNNSISRNEIAVIMSRLEDMEEEMELDFLDKEEIPNWAKAGVAFLEKEKIMEGYEDGSFKGNKAITRAEAAVVVYRYLNYIINK